MRRGRSRDGGRSCQLLAGAISHRQLASKRGRGLVARRRVMVACEERGRTSWLPIDEQGTTQDCPFCAAFVDVGGESAAPPSHGDAAPGV